MTSSDFLKHQKLLVLTRKVLPQRYRDPLPNRVPAVTWQDADGGALTGALRMFYLDKDGSAPMWRKQLDWYTEKYDFGKAFSIHDSLLKAKESEEILAELARRDCRIITMWGYAPLAEHSGDITSQVEKTDKGFALLQKHLGKQFFGFDNGEQDGRFVASYSPMFCPVPATRIEAYRLFLQHFKKLCEEQHDYLSYLAGIPWPHYFAHMGNHRLLGAETCQAMMNIQVWYAFIRGAGKQYGLLWYGMTSIFNRWGFKDYLEDFKGAARSWGLCEGNHGPNAGTSLSLMRRVWYSLLFYNCIFVSHESGFSLGDSHEYWRRDPEKVEGLYDGNLPMTPIGRMQLEDGLWWRQHKETGVQYTPFAVVLDFYTGWLPPVELYQISCYLTWGMIPYSKGDYQIDLFFREIYPDYEKSSYWQDETGYLVPTPYGETFDVLLHNADETVLNQYKVIFVLGDTEISGSFLNRLKSFVASGGMLVVSAAQAKEACPEFYGIEPLKKAGKGSKALLNEENREIDEPPFKYLHSNLRGAKVIASVDGEPLITIHESGEGKVIFCTAPYWMGKGNPKGNTLPREGPATMHNTHLWENREFPSPYRMLQCFREVVLKKLQDFLPIQVEGPAHWILQCTDDPNLYYLYLGNNSGQECAPLVRTLRGRIEKITDLHTDREETVHYDGHAIVPVPAQGFKVLSLRVTGLPVREESRVPAEIIVGRDTSSSFEKTPLTWKPEEILQLANSFGFEGVELVYERLKDLRDEDLRRLAESAGKSGLVTSLNLVPGSVPYMNVDICSNLGKERAAAKVYVEKVARVARIIGARNLTTCGGNIQAGFNQEMLKQLWKNLALLAAPVKALFLYSGMYRVPEYETDMEEFLKGSPVKSISFALDTGHCILRRQDPCEVLSLLKKNPGRVYLNNNQAFSKQPLDLHLPLHVGDYSRKDVARFVKELESRNFEGDYCLNVRIPQGNRKELERSVRVLKELKILRRSHLCLL